MVNRYFVKLFISLQGSFIIVSLIFFRPKISIKLPNASIFRSITTFIKSISPFLTLPSSYFPSLRLTRLRAILVVPISNAETFFLAHQLVEERVAGLSWLFWN